MFSLACQAVGVALLQCRWRRRRWRRRHRLTECTPVFFACLPACLLACMPACRNIRVLACLLASNPMDRPRYIYLYTIPVYPTAIAERNFCFGILGIYSSRTAYLLAIDSSWCVARLGMYTNLPCQVWYILCLLYTSPSPRD